MEEEDQKDIIKKVKMSGAGDENDDIDKDIDVDMDVDKDVDMEEPAEDGFDEDPNAEGFGDEELEENINSVDIEGEKSKILRIANDLREKGIKVNADNIIRASLLFPGGTVTDENLINSVLGINPEADEIDQSDLDAASDYYDGLREDENPCWDGYEMVGMKEKDGKEVPNCVPVNETITEAEYKGKKVTLNKPTKGDRKKFKVYVKNDKGNVVKVEFGDPNMEIRRDNDEARKSFRARHKCSEKKDKTTAGYWSCKMWSNKKVSDITENLNNDSKNDIFVENLSMKDIITAKLHESTQPAIKPDVKPVTVPEEKPVRERRIWQPKTKPKTKPKMEENTNIMQLNGREVDGTSLEVDGVDTSDYPDFSDAYFSYAIYADGTELTDEELDQLGHEYGDLLNQMAYESLI